MSKKKKVGRGAKRPGTVAVLIRFPEAMFEHISRAAKSNWRTRTAEVLTRLDASMEGESFDESGLLVSSPARRRAA